MRLIHIHGFSEIAPESKITEEYRRCLLPHFPQIRVEEFKWNTLDNDLTRMSFQFTESERRTSDAAERLAEIVDNSNEPLILSGYSLGGAVVLRSLLLRGGYRGVVAVILLGAAIPSVTRPPDLQAGDECLRLNYYSDYWDDVLKHAYFNAIGVPAAGGVGLGEPMGFQNLRTGCSHTNDKPFIDTSYCRLLGAICILIAWSKGIHGPGRAFPPWQPIAVGNKPDWDDIYRYHGYIIQQHFFSRKFRAIEEGGVHREDCWSDDLWPVLDTIKAKRQ